jgi:EAL domain-containing protein (putative c-di-GMP-specific phosphodiesterase class I)
MNTARRPRGHEDREEPFLPDSSEGAETGLYLALFELFDEGLLITADELVLEANTAACRLLERDYGQIAGQPLAKLFPSERAFLDARARLFIQGETRGSLEVSLPGDRTRELRFIAAPRIRPGVHALILSDRPAATEDVDRTAGEAPSDTLWPRLAAALDQPVIVVDDKGRVAAANAAALHALDVARSELVGHALESCMDIAWPTADEPPIAHLKAAGRAESVAARVLPGPKPEWRLLVLPLPDRAATPAASATAARSPSSGAAAGDDSLERIFADSPLPTLLCDGAELRIFAANKAAAKAYGYSQAMLCTMRVGALRSAPDGTRKAVESGIWQHRRRDGSTFAAEVLAYPIESASRPGAIVLMHDMPDAPRTAFEIPVRHAVDLDQLDVHFQPLVDGRDGAVRGGEALLRWNHPELGLIPFQRFVGIASATGLLDQMGDWILHAACTHAAGWPRPAGRSTRVTVNLAIEQLTRGDLAERVRHALASSGLPATQLELDLDERVLNEENGRVLATLNSLHEIGVQLAIDDFGRGLASIPRLKRYPVQALKLDPALVREVGTREDSEAIVEAISSMANVLGLDVLARGVEREPQREFLTALGCHLQQGPLFGRPMSAEAFRRFLARPRRPRRQ